MLLTRALSLVALFTAAAPIGAAGHAHGHSRHPAFKRANAASGTDDHEYIVVGSGAGGGPLAARLAIAGHKVLLIEAGGDHGDAYQQRVPALQLLATENEDISWDYWVDHYPGLSRQRKDSKMTWQTPSGEHYVGSNPPAHSTPLGILYPRVGGLGGCSVHNAMITVYPFESDWANIASITGDNSWAPTAMRKYFERLERNRYVSSGTRGHGFNGWLETSLTSLGIVVKDLKLLSVILSAATAMGNGLLGRLIGTVTGLIGVLALDLNADTPNRAIKEGPYQVPIAVASGKRNGPRDFIIQTANAINSDGSRKYQLDIRLNTLVTRVRFDHDGSDIKAVGVDYLEGESLYGADPRSGKAGEGTPGSINASREVILAAGAFNTPQLLKLSGIGPKEELEKFKIPAVVDLPGVGTNLQDRYENTIVGQSDSDFTSTSKCTFLRKEPDPCLERWKNQPNDRGIYATNGIAIAVVKKSSTAEGSDPDILISGAPIDFTGYFPGYAENGYRDARHWSWIALKAHARNNLGTVNLRSTNPRDTPLITFNYFDTGVTADGADEKDLQASYEAMSLIRTMFNDVVPLNGGFKEVWPGPNVTTEAGMKDFIKNEAWGHHASCTCPIGADDDANAVLDSNFRVRGVKNLRVVDASVFPKIPGFYIAVPTYMISEKAADVIIADAHA